MNKGMNTSCFTRRNSLTTSFTWVSALIAYPPDAIVDSLGRVALFLQWDEKDAKYGKGGSVGFRGGESDVNRGRRRE